MTLHVISSESAGNLYLLQSASECLVIEAGLKLQILKQALGYDLSKVVGCLCSHSHGDHSKHLTSYATSGIDCYTSQDTITALKLTSHRIFPIQSATLISIGSFRIMPFNVVHNVPTLGFLINHPESGNILFVTDSAYIPAKFPNLNTIMVEANYDDPLLQNDRAIGAHMSIDTCVQFLRSTDLRQVRNIILLHLSSSNSDSREFVKAVQSVAPRTTVSVADKGINIDISKYSF